MPTDAAKRSIPSTIRSLDGVATREELHERGFSWDAVEAQLEARRWRRLGLAIVLHNSAPSINQYRRVCLVNCGPQAVLTSFTASEVKGLRGWDSPEVHVLAPRGVAHPNLPRLRLHRVGDWSRVRLDPTGGLHAVAPALVIAASSFRNPRSACGLLAAAVQQRLVQPDDLRVALLAACRTRHRRILLTTVDDIAQGADALSEIDLVRLCRTYGLPKPRQQSVRTLPGGRRRYLDAEWDLPDGRTLAAEVDGAHHVEARKWEADQLRQNEIVADGTVVLRFPASVVRFQPGLVAAQLRRVLDSALRSS